jgi:hypothetical protein
MKHSIRLSKIKKREVPKGMRKITVDDKVFFYKIGKWGEDVTILDSDRKPFKEINLHNDCTWHPSDIKREIKSK